MIKNIFKSNISKVISVCFIFLSIFLCQKAEAATLINGAMWSSTIGWINANSAGATPSYGLVLDDANRTIRGQAWSNNIGWVSFDSADVAVCGAAVSYNSSGDLSGYARAIAGGTTESGGWDGCIGFSGTNISTHYDTTTGLFSGAAWGGINVGWVSLAGTDPDYGIDTIPTSSLSLSCNVSPNPIAPNNSSTVTVVASGGTGSYTYGPWSGACTTSGGSPSCTKTYTTTTGSPFTSSITVTSGVSQSIGCSVNVSLSTIGTCKPLTSTSGTNAATSANVGQLVTWTATAESGASISWKDNGVVVSATGLTYPVKYSTIGKKNVTMSINNGPYTNICEVPVGGLPIINNPNFKPF